MPLRFKRSRSFSSSPYGSSGSLSGVILVLILLLAAGFVAYLATSEMEPPTERIEKVIPNERFQD